MGLTLIDCFLHVFTLKHVFKATSQTLEDVAHISTIAQTPNAKKQLMKSQFIHHFELPSRSLKPVAQRLLQQEAPL